jgi:hypothetical protein
MTGKTSKVNDDQHFQYLNGHLRLKQRYGLGVRLINNSNILRQSRNNATIKSERSRKKMKIEKSCSIHNK